MLTMSITLPRSFPLRSIVGLGPTLGLDLAVWRTSTCMVSSTANQITGQCHMADSGSQCTLNHVQYLGHCLAAAQPGGSGTGQSLHAQGYLGIV